LFITGYAENAAVGNGHLELGMELLTKPFSMEVLAAKVCRYAQRTFGVTLALQRDTERRDLFSGGPVERPAQRSGDTVGTGADQWKAEPRCLQRMHMPSPVGEKVHARFHNQPLKRFC